MTVVDGRVAGPCELTLFVSGASDLSARAIGYVRELCDVQLAGRCQLTVVDVQTNHEHGRDIRLLVTPTLVRSLPLPERRIVGDLSDAGRVLLALGLRSGDPVQALG